MAAQQQIARGRDPVDAPPDFPYPGAAVHGWAYAGRIVEVSAVIEFPDLTVTSRRNALLNACVWAKRTGISLLVYATVADKPILNDLLRLWGGLSGVGKVLVRPVAVGW